MSHEAHEQPGPLFERGVPDLTCFKPSEWMPNKALQRAIAASIPQARLDGAQRALAHAEREVDPDWGQQARAHTLAYAGAHETWMTEDVVAAWTGAAPPDARSWGAVIAGLSRAKLIFKVGYRLDAFGSPKPVWRSSSEGTPAPR